MNNTLKNALIAVFVIAFLVFAGVMMNMSTKSLEHSDYPIEYKSEVKKASKKYGVPMSVIYAVIKVESNFDKDAQSKVGARGLMQLMEVSYEWIDSIRGAFGAQWDDFYEPEVSIDYGTWLLRYLYDEFGSWETVYAAYNAGITKVKKWLSDPEYSDDGVVFKEYPSESVKKYVEKVSYYRKGYNRTYNFD